LLQVIQSRRACEIELSEAERNYFKAEEVGWRNIGWGMIIGGSKKTQGNSWAFFGSFSRIVNYLEKGC
jgi:hypothetical protein